MTPDALTTVAVDLWTWVAGPVLALAGLVLTIRLLFPQWTKLADGFRTTFEKAPDEDGETSSGLAVTLAAVGSTGAAAAVGTATAVTLGGAGAIGWVWLFCILVAPLRYAETLLARTDAPGKGAAQQHGGSLARRLLRDDAGVVRGLGWALVVALVVTGFAFTGGVHGAALRAVTEDVLPDAALPLLLGVAVVGAAIAALGEARTATVAGWVGLVGLVVVLGVAFWAAMSDPGRAFGALVRAVAEAAQGAPTAGAFTGALAGEVAAAAVAYALPPLAASTGLVGGVHAFARARSTRGEAAASLYGPFLHAALVTFLGMAFLGTGAYLERGDDSRTITEVTAFKTIVETPSQRMEKDRRFRGFIRARDGEALQQNTVLATDRGSVRRARYLFDGEPADIAVDFDADGKAFRLLRPREEGSLDEAPPADLARVEVSGSMLPDGPTLLVRAVTEGTGSDLAARLFLGGLLALVAVMAGSLGLGLARSLPTTVAPAARAAVGALPGLGLACAAFVDLTVLGGVGLIAAALGATLAALGLLVKAGEVRKL